MVYTGRQKLIRDAFVHQSKTIFDLSNVPPVDNAMKLLNDSTEILRGKCMHDHR